MQKLAEICVKRPVFAGVLILILIVVGSVGFTRLGVDRLPSVENPTVSVSTTYRGASPEAVETEITDKIEAAVNTIAGINELTSTSSEGQSRVTVSFNLEKDADLATQEVRDKVNFAQRDLPDEVEPPIIRKQDPDSIPVLGFAISSRAPAREVTEYVDKIFIPQIESADGVGEVILAGGQLRQINIIPDPYKLRGYGLSVTDLNTALQRGNVEVPGGDVETSGETLTLRTEGRVQSLEGFERLIIANEGGIANGGSSGSVRLRDVARVEDGVEPVARAAELNGKPTVLIYIRKQSGVNTLTTIENVKARVALAKANFPAGYEIEIVRDQSQYIEAAVYAVEEHLIVGSILATLVVLVFLLKWRATVIAALSIPASIIATFGLMWVFGYTLNIITLLALTLAVGIVIDDTIVVIENIFRVMNAKGIGPFEAAVEGTREIGLAVLATTLSLIAVFLPVAFMEGLTGRLLSSFGITMSFAILVSLLVSFTLAPMLGARWLGKKPGDKDKADGKNAAHGAASGGFFGVIDRVYAGMLRWSMSHRWVIVGLCFLALGATPALYRAAPFNFLPDDDESEFSISARAPEGTNLEVTTGIARRIAAEVRKLPGVQYTLVSVNGFGQSASNDSEVFVRLVDIDKRKNTQNEMIAMVRSKVLRKFAADDLRTRVSPPQALRGFSGGGRGVQYVLTGPDFEVLKDAAAKMVSAARALPGVADADTDYIEGKPELIASIDRENAADLGVDVDAAATSLRFLVGGDQVTTYNERGEQYEVHLRGPADFRDKAENIALWTVPSSRGGVVNLDQVASFRRGLGPTSIKRLNRQRQIVVSANTAPGASAGGIVTGLERAFQRLELPAGYNGAPSGSSREQEKATNAFLLAIGLSVVFMYLILAAQFESWVHPITILLTLPLTVPFALLSILIFGQSLNIYSALGILLLFGVVKKNAILQVDHTNKLREEGMNRYDAIIQANRDRLRPILMTTIAFVAGMIPLVISTGTGAGTNRAIGTVIFGGQTLSLLLTLLATPVIYSLFDDLVQWVARVRGKEPLRVGVREKARV